MMTKITIFLSLVVMSLGIYSVASTQKSQDLIYAIELVSLDNNLLLDEYKKLKLEESTLITGALLDASGREQLNMVVPDASAIVYVIETPDIRHVAEQATQQQNQYSMRD